MFNLNLKFQSTRLTNGHTYVFVYPADSDPGVALMALSALREHHDIHPVACTTMMMRLVGKYEGQWADEIESYIEGCSGDYGCQDEQG